MEEEKDIHGKYKFLLRQLADLNNNKFLKTLKDSFPIKNLKLTEDCPEDLINQLKDSHQNIIKNADDLDKLYQNVYVTAGIISKIQNVCKLPFN